MQGLSNIYKVACISNNRVFSLIRWYDSQQGTIFPIFYYVLMYGLTLFNPNALLNAAGLTVVAAAVAWLVAVVIFLFYDMWREVQTKDSLLAFWPLFGSNMLQAALSSSHWQVSFHILGLILALKTSSKPLSLSLPLSDNSRRQEREREYRDPWEFLSCVTRQRKYNEMFIHAENSLSLFHTHTISLSL